MSDEPPHDLDKAKELARRLFPTLWPNDDEPDALEVDTETVTFDLNALYRDARRSRRDTDGSSSSRE